MNRVDILEEEIEYTAVQNTKQRQVVLRNDEAFLVCVCSAGLNRELGLLRNIRIHNLRLLELLVVIARSEFPPVFALVVADAGFFGERLEVIGDGGPVGFESLPGRATLRQ